MGIGYYGDGFSNGSEINNKLAVNGSGKKLESARFKNKKGYLVLGVSPSSACTVYAVMNPYP